MSRVLIDTSAIFALLVPTDSAHERARQIFAGLAARHDVLVITSYVLLETYALLGRRLGLDRVAEFRQGFLPLLEVVWVGAELHERGLDLLLERRVEDLSLVDAVSFLAFNEERLDAAFAFDRHFADAGLPLLD